MTIREMAAEYRDSALRFRGRMAELRRICAEEPMSETERIILRRRICVLDTMERELASTAKYLENYYRRDENDSADGNGKKESGEKAGVSGAETVPEAC